MADTEYDYYRIPYTREEERITFAPRAEWMGGDYAFIPGAKTTVISMNHKVGRVLAQRNANRIMDAMRNLRDALMDAGIDMDEDEEMDKSTVPDEETETPTEAKAGPSDDTHLELQLMEIEQNFIEMEP